jgi:MoaA/NifB/PqqE/SkfB family radical SAM enzyme
MSGPIQMLGAIGDYLLTKRMKHMIVHVTNACNFRCDHCFVDFETKKRDLKLADYKQLGADSESLMWLDIGGGEPFLRKDLADIICAFDSKIVHIPTNGSLIPQMLKTLKSLKERTDREIIIGLSLDGLQETHDKIRKVPGSFEQVWEAYDALRELGGINIKIITVINRNNFNEILPLMEIVHAKGVDFHSVILLRGETMDEAMELPTLIELRDIGPKISAILQRYDYGRSSFSARILRNFHSYLWDTSLEILEQRTQVIPCLAGQTQLVVNGDGKVSSCEMLPPVGSITEQRLPDIIQSDAYQAQVEMIKNKGCHCTHNCAMLDSIFFNPSNLPQLLFRRAG